MRKNRTSAGGDEVAIEVEQRGHRTGEVLRARLEISGSGELDVLETGLDKVLFEDVLPVARALVFCQVISEMRATTPRRLAVGDGLVLRKCQRRREAERRVSLTEMFAGGETRWPTWISI